MSRHSEIAVGATFPEDFRKKFLELVGEFDDTMLPEQTPSIEFDWNGKGEALITYRKWWWWTPPKQRNGLTALWRMSASRGNKSRHKLRLPVREANRQPLVPGQERAGGFQLQALSRLHHEGKLLARIPRTSERTDVS